MSDQLKETNKLYNALEKKAVDQLRTSILRANNDYQRAVGLSGTTELFKIQPYDKDGRQTDGEVYASFTDMLNCLKKHLVEKRKERAVQQEIEAFLRGHSNIHQQLNELQVYVTGDQ